MLPDLAESLPVARAARRLTVFLAPTLLVGVCVVATYSVVRYRWWIVLVYLLAAAAFATYQIRAPRRIPVQRALALGLALAGLATLTVPAFSYLSQPDRLAIRLLLGSAALLAAALCATGWQRGPDLALGVALAGYLAAATVLIRLDPAPRIDVWVTLQQAADGMLDGQNMYTQQWVGSPGVQDAFTYLPGTAVLLAPGRWLAGDVRWMLVLVTVAAVLALRLGAGRGPAAAVGATLLLLPGTAIQVEQAWTEPLLLACLAGWALAVRHRRTGLAILMLALGLASKQHLALLLPVLAVWTSFGWRRTLGAAGLAGVLVLPWFVASPSAFWHDTVTLLVNFQPLVFADTLFIAVLNETGRTPPFWLTGAVVLGTLAAICLVVRRRQPPLGELVRWLALLLLVANLVNKQAFYNQYWLVAGLVLLSWAVPDQAAGQVTADRPADRPAAAAT